MTALRRYLLLFVTNTIQHFVKRCPPYQNVFRSFLHFLFAYLSFFLSFSVAFNLASFLFDFGIAAPDLYVGASSPFFCAFFFSFPLCACLESSSSEILGCSSLFSSPSQLFLLPNFVIFPLNSDK